MNSKSWLNENFAADGAFIIVDNPKCLYIIIYIFYWSVENLVVYFYKGYFFPGDIAKFVLSLQYL